MKYLFLVIFSILAFSCKNDQKPTAAEETAEAPAVQEINLPALPYDVMKHLYDNTNYVDYIFHELPFSVSQNEKPAIQQNLSLISEKPFKTKPADCKPIGREFFQIDGEVVYEADLYFSEGCFGYVFFKDGKALYANQISPQGMNFYGNMINNAMKMQQGGQQQ